MKKYLYLVLTLVLTVGLFTACGCTSQDATYTTAPATMPTVMTTAPSTQATQATTEATSPSIDRGNGPLDNTTANTTVPTETTVTTEGRTRQMLPSAR